MPKIIEGLRESILRESRRALFAEGYSAVTIRGVAKSCGVAVGTVYNYFPSKDMLIASVMLEDWMQALTRIRAAAEQAACAGDGLSGMYAALTDFCEIYSSAWSQYCLSGGDLRLVRERHHLLVGQLAESIRAMCARLGACPDEMETELAAEVLLTRAQHKADFAPMSAALQKLLI